MARYDRHMYALLVSFCMTLGLFNFYPLLFGNWMAGLSRDLARSSMAVSLGYRHAELLRSGVALSVRDWVAFLSGFWVTVFVVSWLAMLAGLCVRYIDTLLTRD